MAATIRQRAAAGLLLIAALLACTAVPQAHARVQLLTRTEQQAAVKPSEARAAPQQQQHQHHQQQRRLLQYTGGTVATVLADPCASQPCANGECVASGYTYVCRCLPGWGGALCQQPTAGGGSGVATAAAAPLGAGLTGYQQQLTPGGVPTPANPAVGVMDQALATGQAPDDIAKFRARGWVRGKILGQRVMADGVARGAVGHNDMGGITGVAEAAGQFATDGRFGTAAGSGAARAAVASTSSSFASPGGMSTTVLQGAAGAQALGSFYGQMPGRSGASIEASGSAQASAQGTVVVRQPTGSSALAYGH